MRQDWSWSSAADAYLELYDGLREKGKFFFFFFQGRENEKGRRKRQRVV